MELGGKVPAAIAGQRLSALDMAEAQVIEYDCPGRKRKYVGPDVQAMAE